MPSCNSKQSIRLNVRLNTDSGNDVDDNDDNKFIGCRVDVSKSGCCLSDIMKQISCLFKLHVTELYQVIHNQTSKVMFVDVLEDSDFIEVHGIKPKYEVGTKIRNLIKNGTKWIDGSIVDIDYGLGEYEVDYDDDDEIIAGATECFKFKDHVFGKMVFYGKKKNCSNIANIRKRQRHQQQSPPPSSPLSSIMSSLSSSMKSKSTSHTCASSATSSSKKKRRQSCMTQETKYAIGTSVRKFFPKYGWYNGTIKSIILKSSTYQVIYEDDDEEEFSFDDPQINNIVQNAIKYKRNNARNIANNTGDSSGGNADNDVNCDSEDSRSESDTAKTATTTKNNDKSKNRKVAALGSDDEAYEDDDDIDEESIDDEWEIDSDFEEDNDEKELGCANSNKKQVRIATGDDTIYHTSLESNGATKTSALRHMKFIVPILTDQERNKLIDVDLHLKRFEQPPEVPSVVGTSQGMAEGSARIEPQTETTERPAEVVSVVQSGEPDQATGVADTSSNTPLQPTRVKTEAWV